MITRIKSRLESWYMCPTPLITFIFDFRILRNPPLCKILLYILTRSQIVKNEPVKEDDGNTHPGEQGPREMMKLKRKEMPAETANGKKAQATDETKKMGKRKERSSSEAVILSGNVYLC